MQLVFVVAVTVAVAEENKVVLPLTYPYALSAPLVYNYQPVVHKLVPKEYEVEVKTYEVELVDTGCKNSFGTPVPCAKAKRQAEEEAAPAAEEAAPAAEEAAPAAEEAAPAAEEAAPAAEEAKVEEVAPVVAAAPLAPYYYTNLYNPIVTGAAYAYAHHHPLTYSYPYVQYQALEPKVHEIEVPTPKFKTVVEKIPIQPACQNMYGIPVPCA